MSTTRKKRHHHVFHVRANAQGGKRKERLGGAEFVRRSLLHVLPSGVKRIRHYGVLASSCKGVKLCRRRVVQVLPTPGRLPVPQDCALPQQRAPP